ncbi:MAG: polyphenol oxidase family protein, partial [Pseudomonadota bacterium]|nr:polyphenol oxidase family protein [Pseudomonadota bacterium]
MSVEMVRAQALGDIPHGFLGRRGGVSTGICAGLNVGLGSDDDPAAIRQNRILALSAVAPGAQLVTLHQVHSPTAIAVTAPYPDDARPHADALVTDRPGLALGILTADCAPILFADQAAGVIGAAHAGWKGAFGGVVEATVGAME